MQSSSSINAYLKDLKIQQYYLKKFYYNSCSEWLKNDIEKCLIAIEQEIKSYQLLIEKNKIKCEFNDKKQMSIFDYVR